jgi:hypothetical protein
MGRSDGRPEIPVLRLELEGIKYSVLTMLDVKHGELQMALERGIDLAYAQLPAIVAERVREGITEAATWATDKAMKEYFGPGGAGYEKIIQQIISYVEGQEVGPRVDSSRDRYIVGGEDAERDGVNMAFAGQELPFLTLEEALQKSASKGLFIWRVSEGRPWMKMYYWNLGVWSVVPREQR